MSTGAILYRACRKSTDDLIGAGYFANDFLNQSSIFAKLSKMTSSTGNKGPWWAVVRMCTENLQLTRRIYYE